MAVDIKFAENLTAFDRYGKRSCIINQNRSWEYFLSEYFVGSIIKKLKGIKLSITK